MFSRVAVWLARVFHRCAIAPKKELIFNMYPKMLLVPDGESLSIDDARP
jgi:hypothetical protein